MVETMNDSCDDDGNADKPYKESKHVDSVDNMTIHDTILHYFIL